MTADAALTKSAAQTRRLRMVGDSPDDSRESNDFYPTPPMATDALLAVESFDGDIWEPACGDGAISKVLEAKGYRVISSDLVDRGYGETGTDFLFEFAPRTKHIITNPPFKLAVQFIDKSLALTTGKVAMLLRITALEGIERRKMFEKTPLARVWIFSKRITFARGGVESHGGGMLAFAWFVWEHGYTGKPTLGWI
ncbi:hypothetical protein UFOVP1672_66 [uncultured Caudovirales phage]|uniref:Uncharacterized protein n=1 Tax=uncultured Caudovirales phage TaxID=2100421 RepID=A0A6J5S9D5_9CAUD|nr:hypothetical protein UFOVP988_4 [uncultured Caudovirales phage]CAB4210351.1 hypothetical protein UFOVP1425_4 [uncultured Caudovirales phage]CAB4223471.1 hypothetical protein UFOVP1672_66 [uncultured Caudovirales phage]